MLWRIVDPYRANACAPRGLSGPKAAILPDKNRALKLLGAQFKRCPFLDNVTGLADLFHLHDSSTFAGLMRKYGYAKVMFNMKDEFLKLLDTKTEPEEKELYHG